MPPTGVKSPTAMQKQQDYATRRLRAEVAAFTSAEAKVSCGRGHGN